MIRAKDLQFVNYFLLNEIDINPSLAKALLQIEVEVRNSGEPDSAQLKGNKLIVSQPSSLTRFLFTVLYSLIKNYTHPGFQRDKLGLGLLFACKDYVYRNYSAHEAKPGKPPVLVSLDKLPIPSVMIKDIVQPLVGKIELLPIMFIQSNFVDACELVESAEKFSKRFHQPFKSVSFHDYPFLVINGSLHNDAAKTVHLIYKLLQHSLGDDTTDKVIRNIVLSEDSFVGQHLIDLLKILEGDPVFIMDFLKFFKSTVILNNEEENFAAKARESLIASDNYLSKHIRTAQKYTPEVFKQWHQWSMVMGLIEKQLEPMRGSMWPTSENVKPLEDEHRQLELEIAREKGKTQLNFEELLGLARSWYGHKAVQPGKLVEHMLRDNRVWKE